MVPYVDESVQKHFSHETACQILALLSCSHRLEYPRFASLDFEFNGRFLSLSVLNITITTTVPSWDVSLCGVVWFQASVYNIVLLYSDCKAL